MSEQNEKLKEIILKEEEKGNVVFMTIEGPMSAPLKEFIKQPADGILYDLNRDRVVVLTNLRENEKWVNDFAVSKVITELKNQLTNKDDLHALAVARFTAGEELIDAQHGGLENLELIRKLKQSIKAYEDYMKEAGK